MPLSAGAARSSRRPWPAAKGLAAAPCRRSRTGLGAARAGSERNASLLPVWMLAAAGGLWAHHIPGGAPLARQLADVCAFHPWAHRISSDALDTRASRWDTRLLSDLWGLPLLPGSVPSCVLLSKGTAFQDTSFLQSPGPRFPSLSSLSAEAHRRTSFPAANSVSWGGLRVRCFCLA